MPYLKGVDLEARNHSFLSEELLCPNVSKTDLSRANMFCNHVVQTVVPTYGDTPQVFTGFENQVGDYSHSMVKFDKKVKLIHIIKKNECNGMYVFQEVKSKKIHVVENKTHGRITEYYGYQLNNDKIHGMTVGETIDEGEIVVHSTSHDDIGNLRYGVNLNTIYSTIDGLNYEDAVVISESAQKKMAYENVEEVVVTINNNDILVNYYGDNHKFKSFPDIGEATRDGILCARRRVNYESAFVELSNRSLKSINFTNDNIFYSKGKVVDIQVYTNIDESILESHVYNNQILRYHKEEQEYHNKVGEILGGLIKGKTCDKHFTPDVSYIYSRSKAMIGKKKWTYEKSEFDGVVIKFTVAYTENVSIGSKISNRYGGKGKLNAPCSSNATM
jgi:DNA-directed RNA polymerase beta subunit